MCIRDSNTTGSLSGSNLTLTHGDPKINFVDSGDNPDYQVVVNAGHFMIKDATASADRLYINASSTTITNNLNVNAGLDVTGTTTSNYLTLSAVNPNITFTDTNDNPDFRITVNSGEFSIEDLTNSATRLKIKADGTMCAGTSGWADVVMRLVLNNPTSGASQMQFQHTGTGTTSTSGFRVGHNGSGGQCWNFENNYFRIATNNAERLRIDSSGRLLVGTTSSFNGGILCIGSGQGTNHPSGEGIKLAPTANTITFLDSSSNGSDTGNIKFHNTVYNNTSSQLVFYHPSGNTGGIKFYTHDGTSLKERINVTNDGKYHFGHTNNNAGSNGRLYVMSVSGQCTADLHHSINDNQNVLNVIHGGVGVNGNPTRVMVEWRNFNNNAIATIQSNSSTVTYGTGSDYRMKENEVAISDLSLIHISEPTRPY